MFYKLAQKYKQTLSNFTHYPPISDRETWENIDDDLKNQIIIHGEKYLNYQYPSIPATAFMAFCKTGNRVSFEEIYFLRRNVLNALVLAECVERQGRFLDDIINGIFLLCEESAWQLPAHNSAIRGTPNHILPDATVPILDLFSCETGAQLSVIAYLLKDSLNKISPIIVKRIYHELQNRIITPYLEKHFWWMGNGNEPMNNWTIWCTQNILITIFTSNQSDYTKSKTLLKAAESIDYFLKEYGEDGCCDEGAQYFHHAGLCLFNAMEVLNDVTDNYFVHLYKNEKIKNIAAYILNVHVDDKYYINFADCSPIAGRVGVREFLFGKRTNNIELMNFAALDFMKNADQLLTKEINLFYRLQSIFYTEEIQGFHINEPIAHKELYYTSVGLFIARDTHYCLAVKAGDNDDSHNHNDTGSFTLYKDGKPMFVDIGVESYTKKTFSPQRYEIWAMQSDYHNLPTINGTMQSSGPQYKATEVETGFGQDQSYIQMNIASAYPDNANIDKYLRTVTLEKEKQILITDKIISTDEQTDIVLNLITYEKPQIQGNLIEIGALGTLKIIGAYANIEIETLPITDARLQIAWDHELYRIKIKCTGKEIALEIQ